MARSPKAVPSEDRGNSTVDAAEVAKFAALAAEWWDPEGKLKPLHALNPPRIAFIRDHLVAHFGLAADAERPLSGLKLLDVGCGGGLLSEPLTRLGAEVTGIDVGEDSIAVARHHAKAQGLEIDYACRTAEDLAEGGRTFDAVLAMEVIEHVADLRTFVGAAARLVAPGGAFFGATLNRTPKAFVTAIVGAEYVLRWLPRGTHDWRKFVRPAEFARLLRASGLEVQEFCGLRYDAFHDEWRAEGDLQVNYMIYAGRPGS